MDFTLTEEHLEVATAAYAANITGGGVTMDAVEDTGLFLAAHDMAERGWLRRGFTEDGELSWFWTPQAEHVFNVESLRASVEHRQN